MTPMQLDLNLLTVFDAVMTERHVTRSAERLHTTQPAVSNALRRLRDQLGDELFLKVPGGVRPTARAEAIWPSIRQSLADIQSTLSPAQAAPATFAGTATLSLSDYAAALLLPRLVPAVEAEAPGLTLRVLPNLHVHSTTAVETGQSDLALGVFGAAKPGMSVETVREERYVCIMRKGHALSRGRLTPKKLAGANHLLVTPSGEATGIVDRLLAEHGLSRRVALTVNQFLLAPRIVADSSLIAVLAESAVTLSGAAPRLHVAPVPLPLPNLRLQMLWHHRTSRDSSLAWLRARIARLLGPATEA
jgi:DNA-binding transcriptional LysR family regulator